MSDSAMQRLSTRVLRALGGVVGARLRSVLYFHVTEEITPEDLLLEPQVIRGEVQLDFDGCAPIWITWEENAGWTDHFSLQVRASPANLPGLPFLNASGCPLWQRQVGTVLESAEVLGERGTPHVLCLGFAAGTVLIGNGDGEHVPPLKLFGDMDQVVVISRDEAARRGELTNLVQLGCV